MKKLIHTAITIGLWMGIMVSQQALALDFSLAQNEAIRACAEALADKSSGPAYYNVDEQKNVIVYTRNTVRSSGAVAMPVVAQGGKSLVFSGLLPKFDGSVVDTGYNTFAHAREDSGLELWFVFTYPLDPSRQPAISTWFRFTYTATFYFWVQGEPVLSTLGVEALETQSIDESSFPWGEVPGYTRLRGLPSNNAIKLLDSRLRQNVIPSISHFAQWVALSEVDAVTRQCAAADPSFRTAINIQRASRGLPAL